MKVTTLPKVRDALRHLQHHITVSEDVASRARLALERMVSIGAGAPAPASEGVDPGE
jgi:quinolinate synthase